MKMDELCFSRKEVDLITISKANEDALDVSRMQQVIKLFLHLAADLPVFT